MMIGENRKSPDVGKVKCIYCKEQHWRDECNKYNTAEERRRHLKGSCFKYLKEGHMSKECKSKKLCVHCGSFNAHHRSLCPKKFDVKNTEANVAYKCSNMIEESAETKSTELPALVSTNEMVLMQTAKVEVSDTNRDNWEHVRLLMDSGSQRSYITESLAKKLKLRLEDDQEIRRVTFGSDRPKVLKTKSTKLKIKLANGETMDITANVVPTISGNIQRNSVSEFLIGQVNHLVNSVYLADSIPNEKEVYTIELLIGNDFYLDIIMPHR